MTDRELLELAARAAGLWDESDPSNGLLKNTGQYWNPLTDDGDAFRLMSDLRLSAFLSEKLQNAHVYAHYQNPASPGVGIVSGGLSAELLRRAIVEAAAQIGRACTSGPPKETRILTAKEVESGLREEVAKVGKEGDLTEQDQAKLLAWQRRGLRE